MGAGRDDWTRTGARWVAVVVLGSASVAGLAWSVFARGAGAGRPTSAYGDRVPERAGSESGGGRAVVGGRIDLNRASAAELELLPGIGATLAARIVEDRRVNGPYRSPADLDRVRGIGPRTIERLADLITVEPVESEGPEGG